MVIKTIKDLNYDFNYNMFIGKCMLANLENVNDRQKVARWMKKLVGSNKTLNEMKLRNDFMYYLVMNIKNSELRVPFSENPPPGPLPQLATLLPGGAVAGATDHDPSIAAAAEGGAAGGSPMLYQCSPDGGAFLAAQPIPRCGAFCYLAVVSRSARPTEE